MFARHLVQLFERDFKEFAQEDFLIKGISVDSREVRPNYCFFAISGSRADGHDYIEEAVSRGARVIILQKGHPAAVNSAKRFQNKAIFIAVDEPRMFLAKVAAEFFDNPAEKLKIVGVTGTNGKTTVSFLVKNLFKSIGQEAGLIGTIYYKVAGHTLPAKNTTPDTIKINCLLSQMVEHDIKYAVMEVSSHALDQDRIAGIKFNTVIFTNLTPEHLDYHKNMGDYFSSKAKLFTNLNPDQFAVINVDDEYGVRLKKLTKGKIVDFGIVNKKAKVWAEDIKFGLDRTSFVAEMPAGKMKFTTRLVGKYNIYNILACICVGVIHGMELSTIGACVENMDPVPGRLERIQCGQAFEVFVDYAHTGDALQNVLSTLRQLHPRKIITVFGCGGERDRTKRPVMGKIASRFSDFLILTNDNPRGEDEVKIIEDIKKGFGPDFKNYDVVYAREQAIRDALEIAKEGDFVLIAGKGHETYQIFKDKTIDSDDREIARKILSG
ncbi:MAG: UDP-N-acetylmuramoyl-L-alanyl-D-glutamate--2,6-diaminopimelate ligase [Candidatus Omnitrophica bacterium]|nr:UDP-N-acetylmuramoyl-L-alanyl-D-glutamate--2,6-diaminopimelate ligase [Candidatus Omnitrophota bacterium]MBU1924651.1 UDP-N-acetylmuramoyl-L-alanyl-D-glutamate--2,6-diaminopimelate ligase [Candidatus Omnitrophota bacterium]